MAARSRSPYLNTELVIELFPAFVFFAVNFLWDFRTATVATLGATILAVVSGILLHRRLPLIAIAASVITLCLGGASLLFDSEEFVKIRPTVGKLLFATALFVGMFARPTFLERVLGTILSMTPRGWSVLHMSWIGFGVLRAAANEFVWRLTETDTWVWFNTLEDPISIVVYILITRLVARHHWLVVGEDEDAGHKKTAP